MLLQNNFYIFLLKYNLINIGIGLSNFINLNNGYFEFVSKISTNLALSSNIKIFSSESGVIAIKN